MNRRNLVAFLMALLLLAPKVGCASQVNNEIETPPSLDIEDETYEMIRFISRDFAPVRNQPYQSGDELDRLSIGTEIIVINSIVNSRGNRWYMLADDEWIYSGNVTTDFSTIHDCSDTHSFDASGFCVGCGKEYIIEFNSMEDTLFYTIGDNTPIRTRPYQADEIINRLPIGTEITIIGYAINERGNLWYVIEDGTWIYSGNVNKVSLGLSNATTSENLSMALRLLPKSF